MKKIFLIFCFIASATTLVISAEFSEKLPIEMKQFVESFSSFSKRDKMSLYAYALTLRYRMEHIESKQSLKKSALEYWRLYGIVSDIGHKNNLNDLDDVIEEILTPTPSLKKVLKRLRWRESAIVPPDGWAESSARMDMYDKKLVDRIMKSPPRWTYKEKNDYLHDYNLTILKTIPEKALPKTLMEEIKHSKFRNDHEKDIVMLYHYLNEKILKAYDMPNKRLKYAQKKAWIKGCLDYYNIPFTHQAYAGNYARKLAISLVIDADYYPIRKEYLPKEIQHYCENNVSHIELRTYIIPKDKPVKKVKETKVSKFPKTKALLAQFKNDGIDTKPMETYFNLSNEMLRSSGNNMVKGLKLLRLKSCLMAKSESESQKFLKIFLDEVKEQDAKEEFENRVIRPQFWWLTTIGMLMREQSNDAKLKHFFDCNATGIEVEGLHKKYATKKVHQNERNYDEIISQKDMILKYYAGTFVNAPTPDFNNKKAIQSGIIPPRWLDRNTTKIKPIAGIRVNISGMPGGGIKLTYDGIPQGRACERLTTLNMGNVIFFNNKTYDGLEYILIDGKKIKTGKHFNYNRAIRLCHAKKSHIISYVKETLIKERRYRSVPVNATCNNYMKKQTIDTLDYAPYGFAYSTNGKLFAVSGTKSYLYDATIPTRIEQLPRMIDNALYLSFDEKGKKLAVNQGRGFTLYDTNKFKVLRRVRYDDPAISLYDFRKIYLFPKTMKLAGIQGDHLSIIYPLKGTKILSITPKSFMSEKKSKYHGPRVMALAISDDEKTLYIGTNRQKIEIWKLDQGFLGFGETRAVWLKTIALSHGREIGALLIDPEHSNQVYVANKGKFLYLINTQTEKNMMTYESDGYMTPNTIQISHDNKYIMVSSEGGIYVWKKDQKIQYEMFLGDGIKGGMFFPSRDDIVTIAKKIEVWKQK